MNITELGQLLGSLEVVIRRKAIIIELYPDKRLSQSQLSEKTGIAPSNLSTYIKELNEHDIIEVEYDKKIGGYSVNFVKLKLRTKELLNEASKLLVTPEKHPLPDRDNFDKILRRLVKPVVQRHAADSIQILSRQYIIPHNSGFFRFLEQHMNDKEIRPVLVTLIKSARNIVREMNTEEKEKVLAELGSKLQVIAEKENSKGLTNEIMNLLEELGAYNIPYEDLKDLYLKKGYKGDDPALFRSLILRNHRDKLMDLWNLMMDHYEHATDEEKEWFDQEFALLR